MYAMSSRYHRVVSRPPEVISVSHKQDGGSIEHWDVFSVDGPVETAEHDGAGVERAHGALMYSSLAFLAFCVGRDGVHHDAGVGYVHRDVAHKDLQRLIRQARCLPQPVGEAGVDRGHGPLARRPESTEPEPEIGVARERVVGGDVHLYLGECRRLLPLLLTDAKGPEETPVQGRMRLLGVEVAVLIEKDLGERELQLLVVAAVRDKSSEIQPAHPDVPVVLDRKRPYPLRVNIPLPKSLQKRVRERRMPDDLAF